jgi:hypothetical protein
MGDLRKGKSVLAVKEKRGVAKGGEEGRWTNGHGCGSVGLQWVNQGRRVGVLKARKEGEWEIDKGGLLFKCQGGKRGNAKCDAEAIFCYPTMNSHRLKS